MPARARRAKVSRQMRSLSSSEEEQNISAQHVNPTQQVLPSSSSLQNTSQQLQDQDFSEKDLLRYIYGAHNFTKNGKNGPSQLEALQSGRSTGISAGGNILANKIRNYLSHDNVSWQPSADQRRLIGHMILTKPAEQQSGGASVDFGIKVIGGRHSATGRLGTFVTKIKPGSVADTVGQLRPGSSSLKFLRRPYFRR
uniref:PDZ domain-containing protein n=1 Tax=Ditylenchus dipsaci TaxID=166011 RepID=A0A915EEY7_9BILA